MTDSNGIPSQGNFNPDSHSSDMDESKWEIPALDGIEFHASTPAAIENTQSLAQLSEATSTSMRAISDNSAAGTERTDISNSDQVPENSSVDPESTAAFNPLAEDADLLPAGTAPADSMKTITISSAVTSNSAFSDADTPNDTSASDATAAEATAAFNPVDTRPSTVETELAESLSVFAEDDDGEKTQIIANPLSGRHAHVDSRSSAHKDEKNTKRALIWGLASVLVIVLIVALAVFFRNQATAQTHEQVLDTCVASRTAASHSSQKLQKVITKNEAVANTSSAEVEDTSALTKIKNAVSQAKASIENEKELSQCEDSLSDVQLKSITSQSEEIVTKQNEYSANITKAVVAVDKSKTAKTVSTSKNSLTAKRQEAQTLYDQSAQKVTDETTRENLQKAIAAADALITQNSKSVTAQQYSAALDTLNNTMVAVQNSMKAYQEAEEKKRQEAESRAEGVCGTYAGTYSDGSTQFTLRGDCTITYEDNSTGTPSSCTFEDNTTGACARVDNEDNPSRISWSMQCSGQGACQSANVTLTNNGGTPSMTVGGKSYSKQ
ncbi:hypothetical protein [Alloscardovia omnicolens]|uniref:hypothetical protein n=1 Tax=Alloscardovia omnicolens TaxID=419015 RepID=UPI003A5F33C8